MVIRKPIALFLCAAAACAGAPVASCASAADSLGAVSSPHRHRLLLLPPVRPLQAGRGFVALNELLFPAGAVGVTGRVTAAAGVSLIPGARRQFLTGALRATPHLSERAAVSAGVYYIGETDGRGFGVIHADASLAVPGGTLVAGAGAGFGNGDRGGRLMLLAGWNVPLSTNVSLVGENWFRSGFNPAMLSVAARLHAGRASADLGVWSPSWRGGGGSVPPLPWISFSWAL